MTEITEDINGDGMDLATYTVDENGVKNGPYKIVHRIDDDITNEEMGSCIDGVPDGPYVKAQISRGVILHSEEGFRKKGTQHGFRKKFIYRNKGTTASELSNGKFYEFFEKGFATFSNKIEILSQEYADGFPVDGPFCWGEIWNDYTEGFHKGKKKNGQWKKYNYNVWNSDGSLKEDKKPYLKCIETYKDDVLDGLYWDKENGIKGQYKLGKKDGQWTKEVDGVAVSMDTYKDGKTIGPFFSRQVNPEKKEWIIAEEGTRNENGKLEGLYTSYWPNGKVKIRCHYKNGILSGAYEEHTSDGKLKKKGIYEDGQFFTGNMKKKLNDKKRTKVKKILGIASILPKGNLRKSVKQSIARLHKKSSTRR